MLSQEIMGELFLMVIHLLIEATYILFTFPFFDHLLTELMVTLRLIEFTDRNVFVAFVLNIFLVCTLFCFNVWSFCVKIYHNFVLTQQFYQLKAHNIIFNIFLQICLGNSKTCDAYVSRTVKSIVSLSADLINRMQYWIESGLKTNHFAYVCIHFWKRNSQINIQSLWYGLIGTASIPTSAQGNIDGPWHIWPTIYL